MQRTTELWRAVVWVGLTLGFGLSARSYDLIKGTGGYVVTWAPGPISMKIMLPTSPALTDGTSQSSSVVTAMQAWNAQLNLVQFSAQITPGALAPGYVGDDLSEIVIDSTVDGDAFGSGVLAITQSWKSGNTRNESDIVLNSAFVWDSYRGAKLSGKHDIRRVVLHELGHVLGLDHPDEASPPQSVTAVMNSVISYSPAIDALQSDDIAGGRALYGTPGITPSNDNFANATTISLGSGSTTLTATNVAATAEAGEPSNGGEIARRSVWWKWTAPTSSTITITTAGSNYDTVLGVYTGSTVSALTRIDSNDDADEVVRTSSVTFGATGGVTYYIAVDGWDGYMGLINLNLSILGTFPTITVPPTSQTVTEGQGVSFGVAASGTPAPLYQWRKNGTPIPGANSFILVFFSVVPSDAGNYTVTVANNVGSVTSSVAVLTVLPLPAITGTSAPHVVLSPGQASSLSVSATGSSLSYQWIRNGRVVPGATANSLSLTGTATQDNGWYVALVTNSNGTRRSSPFFVNVTPERTRVRAWGNNDTGQLNVPAGLNNAISTAGGLWHALALKRDGTIVVWGSNADGQTNIPPGADTVAIAAGSRYSFALKSDGTVRAWGLADSSGVTSVPGGLNNVVAIDAGEMHALALKSDGTVVAWGQNSIGQTTVPGGLSGVVAVAAGKNHSLALKSDGTVVQWGNTFVTGVPPGLASVIAISAGWNYSLALKNDGTVVSWGRPENPVPPGLGSVTAIAAGHTHALALKSDRTVASWLYDDASLRASSVPADLIKPISLSTGRGTPLSLAVCDATPTQLDFNDDGCADILWQNLQTGQRYVWFMNGSTTIGDASLGFVSPDWSIVGAADFNGDGKADILWQNLQTGQRYVWFMNGSTTIGDASLGFVSPDWSIVGAADFNGDGQADILWQNLQTGQRYVWFMNGSTTIGDASLGVVPPDWSIVGAADFNGDGKADILWQNLQTGQRYVWFMNGSTTIGDASLGFVPPDWSIVGAADLNGDGKADILWQNTQTGQRYVWFMNGSTTIGDASLGFVPPDWSIAN